MTDLLNRRATLYFVIVFAVALWTVGNLPWHLDEYDQAKQAFTSFEMVTQGHWFYQHTPNGWVATKPPLMGWISSAIYALTRSWELAWRLPSALAALLLLFLITRSAAVYGAEAALIAASAFSLNLFTPRLATLARTDMPLALLIFAIGLVIWDGIRRREPLNPKGRLMVFVILTAAMLTKGPIVIAFLLPGMVLFQIRAWAIGESRTAWFGWWPWFLSLAIFMVWVIRGIFVVPDFFEHVVIREFAGRFGEVMHRPQPIYFYLPHLLYRFAPWSILLILLVMLVWRGRDQNERNWIGAISPETFWLIAWSIGALVVMSFVPSKRIDRIFPIVPPLCLLLSVQVGECRAMKERSLLVGKYCLAALLLAGLLTTGYVTDRVIAGYRNQTDALARFGSLVRNEANAHGWTFAVVGGDDEGMALYLRKTEFLEPEEAAAEWTNSKLDGLVVPEDELIDLLPRLPGAVPSKIGASGQAGRYHRRYVFLVRS